MGYGKKSKYKKKPILTMASAVPMTGPQLQAEVVTTDQARKALDDQFNRLINDTMLVCIDILYNNFGKLQRRDGRLRVFWDLFMRRLADLDKPTSEIQRAAYNQFKKETGMTVEEL